jgi:hypothetical protein
MDVSAGRCRVAKFIDVLGPIRWTVSWISGLRGCICARPLCAGWQRLIAHFERPERVANQG